MYYLNKNLLEKLPSILKMTRKALAAELGVSVITFGKWMSGDIPCSELVRLCNRTRITLSEFLVLKENPEVRGRATDYVTPAEKWKTVEWNCTALSKLFGDNSITGLSKTEAAKVAGKASYQIFDYWASNPTALRVGLLLAVLNHFKIDASLLFTDPNVPIPLPVWEANESSAMTVIEERMKDYRKLERTIAEKQREIQELRGESERINRENRMLRSKLEERKSLFPQRGMLMESPVVYGNPFSERGFRFHIDLWDRLPELFDMKREDFCAMAGIDYRNSYEYKNILVSVLVKVCNELRISISHFFVPVKGIAPVHDSGYYTMSPRMFKPIEDCMENLKYLFGRYSATGFDMGDLKAQEMGYSGWRAMAKKNGTARVITLCDICTTFGFTPSIFFKDENQKKSVYSESANERLFLNSIELAKENEQLRIEIRRLKKKKGEE